MVVTACPLVESLADSLADPGQTFAAGRVEPRRDGRYRLATRIECQKAVHEARDRYGRGGLAGLQGFGEKLECRFDAPGGQRRMTGCIAPQVPSDFVARHRI